jgi:hypothetical protein
LSGALRAALDATPLLLSPGDVELADLVPLPSEAVAGAHNAVLAGVETVEYYDPTNRPPRGGLTIIGACLRQDGTEDACTLGEVLNTGGTGGRWLELRGHPNDASKENRRWVTRLGASECAAYRRYVAAVLDGPLDQFAAKDF